MLNVRRENHNRRSPGQLSPLAGAFSLRCRFPVELFDYLPSDFAQVPTVGGGGVRHRSQVAIDPE
jgi:hypothetical protein